MGIIFDRDVRDDPMSVAMLLRHSHHTLRRAGDERYVGSAAQKLADQREAEAGGPTGNRHPFTCTLICLLGICLHGKPRELRFAALQAKSSSELEVKRFPLLPCSAWRMC